MPTIHFTNKNGEPDFVICTGEYADAVVDFVREELAEKIAETPEVRTAARQDYHDIMFGSGRSTPEGITLSPRK